MEFYKTIPFLTTATEEQSFVFEIIIPFLPGFGLSSTPRQIYRCFGYRNMSMILKDFMLRIGHNQFYVHGRNWTSYMVRHMSTFFPQHVLGMNSHLYELLNKWENVPYYLSLTKTNKLEMELLSVFRIVDNNLNDSPVALATYIIEKFVAGTNLSETEVTKKYTFDELIDNLMIYWMSECIITSNQVYASLFFEEDHVFFELLHSNPVKIPRGFTQFIYKTMALPKSLRNQFINILRISCSYRGRFPALEEPEYFAYDVCSHIHTIDMCLEEENAHDNE